MVAAAQRDGEFIAHLAAQCWALREAHVVPLSRQATLVRLCGRRACLDPVDVLHYAIDELGHSQAELADILGSRSRASEVRFPLATRGLPGLSYSCLTFPASMKSNGVYK